MVKIQSLKFIKLTNNITISKPLLFLINQNCSNVLIYLLKSIGINHDMSANLKPTTSLFTDSHDDKNICFLCKSG